MCLHIAESGLHSTKHVQHASIAESGLHSDLRKNKHTCIECSGLANVLVLEAPQAVFSCFILNFASKNGTDCYD